MDPRAEAFDRLGGRYEVRVLEPSPPAATEEPWLADDPAARGEVPPGRQLVAPVEGAGDLTWDELCRRGGDAELAGWCAERWVGAWARLPDLPPAFAATRAALHAVAEHVIAPARYRANGKIGLRFTRRGFGTPFFGADRQVRIDSGRLVVDDEGHELTTVRAAAAAVGIEPGAPADVYSPTTACDLDASLPVDGDAAVALGHWYGFCASVLEQLRAEAAAEDDPSRVQLWPEHFDLAVEVGAEPAGQRAAYGGSPGDEGHPEPYLYVAPWQKQQGEFWSDPHFGGASLSYADLLSAPDQRQAALDFLRRGRIELSG